MTAIQNTMLPVGQFAARLKRPTGVLFNINTASFDLL
jgi:hypothetical protein